MTAPPLLELTDVHKRFGGVRALNGTDFRIQTPGTVQGLIGQNGCGKSTLLNILTGQLPHDHGTIRIDGEEVHFRSPTDAANSGLAVVSQETALAPDLTMVENVLLGPRLVRKHGHIDWDGSGKRASTYLAMLGLHRDPETLVRDLAPDEQQLVEIARALSMDVRILILDEPTSSLTDDEVARLFATIRSLADRSVSVVFVSHRLTELFEIADHVTVLRDGRTISAGPITDYDTDRMVADMVGRERMSERVEVKRTTVVRGPAGAGLEVRGLTAGVVRDVSLDVAPGEIVGIAGLVGAGRSELLESIFGLRRRESGSMHLGGEEIDPSTPREAIAAGFAYVPPDRKNKGVLLQRTVEENLSIVSTKDRSWWRRPTPSAATATELCRRLNVRADSLESPASSLSGGNQQKLAIGKWLATEPRCLLLDEPMRGVDVYAKGEIYDILRATAEGGVSLLVSSSENEELLGLCDRILIMVRGRLVDSVMAADVSDDGLTKLSGGAA